MMWLAIPVLFFASLSTAVWAAEREAPAGGGRMVPQGRPGTVAPAGQFRVDRPLSLAEMTVLLQVAGWPDGEIVDALAVAGCESGWNPAKTGDAGEMGLFQIHPVHGALFSEFGAASGRPYDPLANAIAARVIWEAEGWEPWTCAHAAARDASQSTE